MLFVTNRQIKQTPAFSEGRKIEFDLKNNQAGQSVYFCARHGMENYVELGNEAFFDQLRKSKYRQVLLFIHGFSCLPESGIFSCAEKLQALFDAKKAREVLVVPAVWPCDDDMGMVKDYFDDQIAADASDVAFARVFEKFLAWQSAHEEDPCLKRINLLAHSMGNRVLRGSLLAAVRYYQQGGLPMIFRNIFMAAADVVNESLEPGQEGEPVCRASRNVVVYYAGDDLALRASKAANLGSVASRRLGHTGPENMDRACPNVYALDCDSFNTTYDPPRGHSYFTTDRRGRPGRLFNHMWDCIRTGRVGIPSEEQRSKVL